MSHPLTVGFKDSLEEGAPILLFDEVVYIDTLDVDGDSMRFRYRFENEAETHIGFFIHAADYKEEKNASVSKNSLH